MSTNFPISNDPFDSQLKYEQWLESLKDRDPALYFELTSRLAERVAKPATVSESVTGISLESVATETGVDVRAMALETIVREGRPAFPIQDGKVNFAGGFQDAAAKTIVETLTAALPTLEPLIPLVGRIDVDNYPIALPFLGTGWLVDQDLVVTNRHVAELMAQSDNGKFRFRPGRLGEPLRVALDYLHELGSNKRKVRQVREVLWIEKDSGPDIAFIRLKSDTSVAGPPAFKLAENDAKPGDGVVVVGYPAKAPAHIIPNQEWMDRIYGGVYDIKRIAPGLMGANNLGSATHDCTTLGGNSGSVVIDMKSGKAVALHFAGRYMIENYAVPASTIKQYLKNPPWLSESVRPPVTSSDNGTSRTPPNSDQAVVKGGATAGDAPAKINAGEVSITIPLKITVSLGTPEVGGPSTSVTTSDNTRPISPPPVPANIDEAANVLLREHRTDGVLTVWPGFEVRDGLLTDNECLVVSAHPDRVAAVRQAMPTTFANYPVEVRPASIDEQMEAIGVLEAPVTSVQYNDDDRTGEGFSFDWIEEEMDVLLHVGPERSWVVLSGFLQNSGGELVSSMYEFHAAHIAEAIEKKLDTGTSLTLVLASQSRDPKTLKPGNFDRSETFDRWEKRFKKRFDRIFVPQGAAGLVANAYHIKVTVTGGNKIWLSSGNWKSTSQPVIAKADLNNPKVTGRAGNREWHVVIENETLANRFRNHIKADFEQCLLLGGTPESLDQLFMVDVRRGFEAIELEAAPAKVIEERPIRRVVRVQPLLTPDKKGAVFSNAVLKLIRSAKKQLVFQNQYIKMSGANSGFLKELVDALGQKAKELPDFRMILRNGDLRFDLTQLKRRGVKVNTQVRILDATHTKGIVVDGKQVLIGSHNWSSSGVTLNRDASLIFDDRDIAQYYLEAFEIDWQRAREPRFDQTVRESVRPAEGDEPPPGFERMTLSDYLEG